MGGDGYEYPDEAGYPDGTGTLDEGTRERAGDAASDRATATGPASPSADETSAREDDVDRETDEIADFASEDVEDDEGV
ncbi:hypothetical protein [Agromyces sp. LHK192]|uniref:hypothetical protein n=1 Tax=Agromyces sp. LHK192 TaxID=2498704 RepID=UPI000FD9052E|nr:hypothetical protein [Agromyces sp. LHK192]